MQFSKPLLIGSLLLSATSFNAQAALTSYTGANGVNLVYDNVTNLTWTKDANLFKTLYDANNNLVNLITAVTPSYNDPSYGNQIIGDGGAIDDFDTATGRLSWWGSLAFTNYLNSINYGGSHQWALPSAGSNPQFDYNLTGTAFGHLFYNELGGTFENSIPNTATFDNEKASAYWLGTEYAPLSYYAWRFTTGAGYQYYGSKEIQFDAWAVSPGQVAAVPVPGAVWLMGSGLLGLLNLKRRGHAGQSGRRSR